MATLNGTLLDYSPKQQCKWNAYFSQCLIIVVLFICGAPLTMVAFKLLRHTKPYHRLPTSFRMLQYQLNISDLLVIFVYCPCKLMMNLLESNWPLGGAVCAVMRFIMPSILQLSANIISAIALDRLVPLAKRYDRRRSYYIVATIWTIAIVLNIFQLPSWTTKTKFLSQNTTTTICAVRERIAYRDWDHNPDLLNQAFWAFHWIHMMSSFWIPASIVLVSYSIIVYRVFRCANALLSDGTDYMENGNSSGEKNGFLLLNTNMAHHQIDENDKCIDETTLKSKIRDKKVRILKICFAVCLTHLLCWTPFNVMAFMSGQSISCWRSYVDDLVILNSVINPIIYVFPGMVVLRKSRTEIS